MSLFQKKKREYDTKAPKCVRCGLFKNCDSPKMFLEGKGQKDILVVVEQVTDSQDKAGDLYSSSSIKYLEDYLYDFGIDLKEDCYLAPALACNSESNVPDVSIKYCRPHIFNTIKQKKPKLVLLFGIKAVKSVIGKDFTSGIDSINKWRGFVIPGIEHNAWFAPQFPIRYYSDNMYPGYDIVIRNDLENALSYLNKPVPKKRNDDEAVTILTDIDSIVKLLVDINKQEPKHLSFDYETNMLNPYSKEAKVYTVGLCYEKKRAYSFPLYSKVVPEFLTILNNPKIGKIAHNIQMENKWTHTLYMLEVKNWIADTMNIAHILDNRSKVTSLDFQVYMNFGIPPYNEHIKEYLRSPNPNTPNRIDKINKMDLLLYGGKDALYTHRLFLKQQQILKQIGE